MTMKDPTLFKLSFIISLLGILLLLYISENINLNASDISAISHKDINKDVKISGRVTSSRLSANLLLLNVQDKTTGIKVVIFEPENLNINPGSLIEVQGKVALYKDELEVIASKVTLL